jgi:hypothetical protein
VPNAWRRAWIGRATRQQECVEEWTVYSRGHSPTTPTASFASAIARTDPRNQMMGFPGRYQVFDRLLSEHHCNPGIGFVS